MLQQLEVLIEEAEELHETYAVSQAELDSKEAALEKTIEDLKASQVDKGEDDPFTEATVSFKIMGENLVDDHDYIEFFPINERGTSHSYEQPNYKSELINGGIQFDITDMDETEATVFYVVIQTNGYLLIEELSPQEVKEGAVRNIKIDDSYVPLHLSLPDDGMNEDINHEGIILQVIGEKEKAIFNTDARVGTKIPSGTYHVQYTGTGNDASYGFFKNNVRLDQQNSTVTFSKDDVALMEFTLEQKNPANYKLDHLAPLYWADGKYDSIRHVNFEEDVNSIYLSKLEYEGIHVYYQAEKNQQQWELMFDLGQVNLQDDKEFAVSDNLMVKAERNDHLSEEDRLDIEKPFYTTTSMCLFPMI